MAISTLEKLYTAEEFWEIAALPENEDKILELEDGVIIEVPAPKPLHSFLAARLVRLIGNFVEEHKLGYVLGADGGYTLSPRNVRIPDVSFVSKERYPTLPERFEDHPDLAVEVVSPSDKPGKLSRKITLYLQTGVRLIWVVYSEEKQVAEYRLANGGTVFRSLELDGTLDGGEVLPNFKLPVKDIFAE